MKNIAEDNNLKGKELFHEMEEQTQIMDSYLRNLKEGLSTERIVSKNDMRLQRWKLD
jgi:hypothetical protein